MAYHSVFILLLYFNYILADRTTGLDYSHLKPNERNPEKVPHRSTDHKYKKLNNTIKLNKFRSRYIESTVPSNLNDLLLNLNLSHIHLSSIKEKWIVQPLDHFDSQEKRTYRMRYFENLKLWKPNAPIYIAIGGESEQIPGHIANHGRLLITQIGRETNGALFASEHRYYGKSLPSIPKYDPTNYYKFLSSQQALADLAALIKMLKSDPKYERSKVVVLGGSYAGNLAAWMRLLYPDLVDAAVSISAPLLAKKDFSEYLDGVRYTFGKYGSKNCLNNITNTYKRYEKMLRSFYGIKNLKQELTICPYGDLTVLENKQLLFTRLYMSLALVAKFGPPSSVKDMCNHFETSRKLSLDHLNLTGYLWNGHCLHVDFSAFNSDTSDPWIYQTCTEFGYQQTTSSEKQPFVHWKPLDFSLKFCNSYVQGDVEKRMDQGVANTNRLYGGLTPNVTKVVFTHGDMDPWHSLGIQKDLGPNAPATIVNGTAHCGALVVRYWEPVAMKKNRKYIKELVKKWIAQ